MWTEIRLRSLGIIHEASLELGPGFTVVTGETGAGKTMVVSALDLLRGERADSGLVRRGESATRVEARLDVAGRDLVEQEVVGAGGELDDGELILSRTVSAEGRSRAHVGGVSVPVGLLRRLSDQLVAVHGQSDQHRLLRPAAQRDALDRYGGDRMTELLSAYRPAYARFVEVNRRLADLDERATERAREADLLRYGLGEIATVEPQPDEDDLLKTEADRLAHADGLRHAAQRAHGLLTGDEADGQDAATTTVAARSRLDGVRGHDAPLDGLADRVTELSYQLTDVGSDLAAYAASVETDPARLDAVQERRATLAGLTRKYGATLHDVLTWGEEAGKRLTELDGTGDQVTELETELPGLVTTLAELGGKVSELRRETAHTLGEHISRELYQLAMPHAHVLVDVRTPAGPVTPDQLGPDGVDEVELLLAANVGSTPRPLGKGASGGELSRVMLAVEVVLADTVAAPLFVFDEVDAGVGGQAAVEVGRRLARLATTAQVLAVTHLPQVAAFADRHYHVVKSDDGTVTTSDVHLLDGPERVRELSRMLAGLEGSATAEAHVLELLAMAADHSR